MKLIITLLLSITTIGCDVFEPSEHAKLAESFVNSLEADMGFRVDLLKLNTKQKNYILVKDLDSGNVDAYDLTNYTAGTNMSEFLLTYDNDFYFELGFYETEETYVEDLFPTEESYFVGYEYDPYYDDYVEVYETEYVYYGTYYYEDVYIDSGSRLLFSKAKMTTSDLAKAEELVDGIRMNKTINNLTIQFGLSPKRAKEVAGYALQLGKSNPTTMTTYKYNQYAKAVLGNTISDIQSAVSEKLSGNNQPLDAIYNKAAQVNGISVNKVKELSNLFIKN